MEQEETGVLDVLSFRLIKFEYYLNVQSISVSTTGNEKQYSFFVKEPIVRLFGRSTDSMDVCIHVHNYYPYFFVCIDPIFTKITLVDWMMEFERGIEKFLREKEPKTTIEKQEKENKKYKHVQSIQLIRGKSIYGYHDSDQLFLRINLYDPNEIVSIARAIANGTLPKPDVLAPEDEDDYFPALLAYEHKYNYKLKFLTDFNLRILTMVTIRNVVLRPPIDSVAHSQLFQEHFEWCRQSVCSIEGDILISNIDTEMNVNGEYLIPSLLLLKKKVDKIFGSQKVVSLSEDRPIANEMTCGDELGYLQFKLFAENILKQNSISTDHSIIADSKPDLASAVDADSITNQTDAANITNPTNKETINLSNDSSIKSEASSFDNLFLNEDEWNELLNEVTENEEAIHPEVSAVTQESEIHSSILLSFISQFEKTTVSNPSLPSSISSSQVVHTYSYSIEPPSRSLHSLQHHMKEVGIPPVYYNDLTGLKEFNPTGFLASYSTSSSSSHSLQTNRILFWKDLLHDQFNTEELSFHTYIYSKPPPRISIHHHSSLPSSLPSSIHSISQNSISFSSSSASSQSISSLPPLRLFAFELLCENPSTKKPNPKTDEIIAIFYDYSITDKHNNDKTPIAEGLIINISKLPIMLPPSLQHSFHSFHAVQSEQELLVCLINCILSFNPDIILAYETQRDSIGYLVDRCEILQIPFLLLISRTPFTFLSQFMLYSSYLIPFYYIDEKKEFRFKQEGLYYPYATLQGVNVNQYNTAYNQMKGNTISLYGRYVLSVSRMLRRSGYHNKNNIDYCAIIQNQYHKTVPRLSNHTLYTMCQHINTIEIAFNYIRQKSFYIIHILFHSHILNRIIESCSIQGIDIEDEFTRGSQYKIENILLRINNHQSFNYICLNATEKQLSLQPPTVSIPLVMEPYSKLYSSPVIILDFQSLYPSIMIAYNICFSTCLGNINKKTGVGMYTGTGFDPSYQPSLSSIRSAYEGGFHVSPTGAVFVNRSVRTGIIVKMVEEILRMRILIKNVLKQYKNHPQYEYYQSILDFNQLALKMIVNTTYGYINAGFSGRMPNAQLGDSIVEYGRVILNQSIQYVEKNYPALSIVYADTDSMFLLCNNMTRHESFLIGKQLEDEISALFPAPITLKFEKLYHPCILVTKKRYCGYCYMNENETPFVEGKGIEMIRSDQCEYIQQISYELLLKVFSFCTENDIKLFIQGEFQKLLANQIPVSSLVLWKEVKLGNYKTKNTNETDHALSTILEENEENSNRSYYQHLLVSNSSLPPAAVISIQNMLKDEREIPLYKEKVPYIVVFGEPGSRLKDNVISPYQLYMNDDYKINSYYYIHKQVIPILNRLTQIFQIDVNHYFDTLKVISSPSNFFIPFQWRQIEVEWPKQGIHFPFEIHCKHCFDMIEENNINTMDNENNENNESNEIISPNRGVKRPFQGKSIESFYNINTCFFCGRIGSSGEMICPICKQNPTKLLITIGLSIRHVEAELNKCNQQCLQCLQCIHCEDIEDVQCTNISCDNSFLQCSLMKEYKYYLFLQDLVYSIVT